MKDKVAEIKRRLNLDRPDIAAMRSNINARATYPIADIHMAWDLITRFEAENKRYKQALEEIAHYQSWDFGTVKDNWKWCNQFIDIAKRALEERE